MGEKKKAGEGRDGGREGWEGESEKAWVREEGEGGREGEGWIKGKVRVERGEETGREYGNIIDEASIYHLKPNSLADSIPLLLLPIHYRFGTQT